MNYEFLHESKAYTPEGTEPRETDQGEVDARNRQTERTELAWLATHPDRVFLYVKEPPDRDNDPRAWYIVTWLGTIVSEGRADVGRSVRVGGIAGTYARRRSIVCRIFGVRYVGWYYESSGSYCRLRKAKRQ